MLFISQLLLAQVGINNDGSLPHPSAGLDVKFTNKGILLPRMNMEQRNAITDPAEGLILFCTDCGTEGAMNIYLNETWKSLSPCLCEATVPGDHLVSGGQIVWKWCTAPGAAGYKWNTTNNYNTAVDMGAGLSKTETGILCNTVYTRYVWSYNTCATSTATVFTETIPATAPAVPTAGTQVPYPTQIVWNWNPVSDAEGYKWNTVNDYNTAADMGINTTKTETALACSTTYNRFVWAYNGCGLSTRLKLTQTTLVCWICGTPVTKSHVAGNVAPVNKTVIYGTVTNVPGEPEKCWITSNLGADHQAANYNDNTEASAGWYWQFNRKQGFNHDGSTRTPVTTWITSIIEYSNWISDEDPCTLELGTDWRIPTKLEWDHIVASGGWGTYVGPWNSLLKMHMAGYLYSSNGTLRNRGSDGYYWSSTQSADELAWKLGFSSGNCGSSTNNKTFSTTIRCIKQ